MKSCPLARELSRALLRVTPSDSSDCHAATPSISLALFLCILIRHSVFVWWRGRRLIWESPSSSKAEVVSSQQYSLTQTHPDSRHSISLSGSDLKLPIHHISWTPFAANGGVLTIISLSWWNPAEWERENSHPEGKEREKSFLYALYRCLLEESRKALGCWCWLTARQASTRTQITGHPFLLLLFRKRKRKKKETSLF